MNKQKKDVERAEAIEHLREYVKPGDKVYFIVRKVARSGMSRCLSVYVMSDGAPMYVTGWVAKAIGCTLDRDNDMRVPGCGMDMCFWSAYQLGRVLFPDGGPLEKSSREHQERRAGEPKEKDGGYLLRHQTL